MTMANKGAKTTMLMAMGLAAVLTGAGISTPAMAQRGYYEAHPMYDDQFYRQPPPRRSYQQPGYYPDQGWQDQRGRERGYYHQPRRGYGPQPQFYDKEAAKDYWRSQKEAQKRAIKRGYYNQPQQMAPQPGWGGGGGGVAAPYRRGGGGATALD